MRPEVFDTWLDVAEIISRRGTCARRKVGCVLVDKSGKIMSTGYNGVAAGEQHCSESACPGACYPSGQGLEFCEAIHAEANALLQCEDVTQIGAAYVTVPPCVHCVKLLMNTGCQVIYFRGDYPHSELSHRLWTKSRGPNSWIRVHG